MSSADQPPSSKKKIRFSQQEARVALIEAGKKLLVDRGLDSGLGLVTLNDAIALSGVPRASAYRAFTNDENDPQVTFRTELLVGYVSEDPLRARADAATNVIDQALQSQDTSDPVQLATTLREIIRLGFAGNVATLLSNPHWRIMAPSWAATALNGDAPQKLVEAHRAASELSANYFIPIYKKVAETFGLRLRAGLDWQTIALLAESAPTVDSIYRKYHPSLHTIERATGPDGEMQTWSHAAILVEGLILANSEPDPEADVSADLKSWL